MQLVETIKQIQPLNETAMQLARERQNMITKPAGSLGRLEELSIQLAGMMGKPMPVIRNKTIIIMAGDHGVVAEGVSAYPQEVTRQMVLNFLAGGAAINVLARHVGAKVVVADMGVAREIPTTSETLIRRKIGAGTMNLARGPAMSREQAEESVQSGIDIALGEIFKGADILGAGDMGIGNTTPSAAIACALMGVSPDKIAGHGTGINDEGLERKISAIVWGLENNRPNTENGLDVLAKVGGFEIGGLAGVMIGAASKRVPVMVDGFISTAAAMIAVTIAPQCKKYLIAAHRSRENGHMLMLEWLGLKPLLDLDMRLGEGSGAAIGISLAEAACKVLSEMATFAEAGVSEKDS